MRKLIYLILIPLIVLFATISSCNGKSSRDNKRNPNTVFVTPVEDSTVQYEKIKPVLNVYLENSGSMDGYVNGGSDFASIIYRYLNHIDNSGWVNDSINLHYINSDVIPLGNDIALFSSKNLTPASFKKMGGSIVSTDISDLLKQVLIRTNNDTISVLISDMIFSPGSKVDASQYLEDQKTEIMSLFTNKVNNSNLSVVIHQLSTAFNGTYFNKIDAKSSINENRPFYIIFFGNKEYLEQIQLKTLLQDDLVLKHIENKYLIAKETPVEYAIQVGSGKFKLDKKDPQKSIVKAKVDKKTKNISCVVNVNFDNTMLDDSYLTDIDNYFIDNNYQIESIKPSALQGFTHSLKWNTVVPQSKVLSIGLSNKIPEWVDRKNDSLGDNLFNDDAIDRTYGLKYLIEGIYEPYRKVSEYYTKIEININ